MNIYGLYLSIRSSVVDSMAMNHLHFLSLLCILSSSLQVQAAQPPQSQQHSICINAIRTENFVLAKQLCEKQLKLAQQTNNQKDELSLLIALLDIYKQTDDIAFYEYVDKVEKHPLFVSSPQIKYQWLRLQAIKLHHAGKLKESNHIFSQALQIAINLNDEIKISNSNIDLGI